MPYTPLHRVHRRLDAARGYLSLEMHDQALDELDDLDPPPELALDWHVLRGEALRVRKEFRAAIRSFLSAQAIKADRLDVLMGLAWCYKRTNQLPKSIEMMHQAHLAHRDEPIVLYNLACYYSLAGDKDHALSWLGRALRMQADLRVLIAKETDFDPIRDDADFQRLIELTEPGPVNR